MKKFYRNIQQRFDNLKLSKKLTKLVFIFSLILVSIAYHYPKILFLRPQTVHQWRQCDCLSITMNYYHDGMKFFQPSLHNLGDDGTGKAASDCPLLYYFIASLWQLFGPQEVIYRLVVLFIVFLGLYAVFRVLEDLLNDSFWAIGIPLLLFTSTILVYYTNNFLMNAPAFGFALIAWYYFYRYYKSGKIRHFYFSGLFFLIGTLLKVPAGTSLVALFIIFVFELILHRTGIYKREKIFKHPLQQLILFLSIGIVVISWYAYASYYSKNHNGGFFLIGTLPIFNLSADRIAKIWENIRILWLDKYLSIHLQLASIVMVFIVVFSRKAGIFFRSMTFLLTSGFVGFVSLWFSVFDHHDYYLLNQVFLFLFIMVGFISLIKNKYPRMFKALVAKLLFLILLIYNILLTSRKIDERYNGWWNFYHTTAMYGYATISPYLGSLGIQSDDTVMCLGDQSINIPLYLMNRKGWTEFGGSDSARIADKIHAGAAYLFIHDTTTYNQPYIKSFTGNKIGHYYNIDIYNLHHWKNNCDTVYFEKE